MLSNVEIVCSYGLYVLQIGEVGLLLSLKICDLVASCLWRLLVAKWRFTPRELMDNTPESSSMTCFDCDPSIHYALHPLSYATLSENFSSELLLFNAFECPIQLQEAAKEHDSCTNNLYNALGELGYTLAKDPRHDYYTPAPFNLW